MVHLETDEDPEYLEVANQSGLVEYTARNPGKWLDTGNLSSGFYTVRA
jgi:hypothetical protein